MQPKPKRDDPALNRFLCGLTSQNLYNNILKTLLLNRGQSLKRVTFNPITGEQRHYFNGRLEKTLYVRGIRQK